MALRAPAPLPAAGRGTISRYPLIGLPPLASCYSTYLSCTRACFAFAVARCCHRWCLVAFFVLRSISSSRRCPCSSIVGLRFSIARRPSSRSKHFLQERRRLAGCRCASAHVASCSGCCPSPRPRPRRQRLPLPEPPLLHRHPLLHPQAIELRHAKSVCESARFVRAGQLDVLFCVPAANLATCGGMRRAPRMATSAAVGINSTMPSAHSSTGR